MSSHSWNDVFQNNSGYVDDLYERYLSNPAAVSIEWRAWFDGFQQGFESHFKLQGNNDAVHYVSAPAVSAVDADSALFELKVAAFVHAYKCFGHLYANVNPLKPVDVLPKVLDLNFYNFSDAELQKVTQAATLMGWQPCPLSSLAQKLQQVFCGSVGFEFEQVQNPDERNWLYQKILEPRVAIDTSTQLKIYGELVKAEVLEKTIALKFVGKKRFSIEGADAQIVALEAIMDKAVQQNSKEFCIGMAHRGRLNILVNVAGKPAEELAAEFEGYPSPGLTGTGDVKYHNGYESVRTTRSGNQITVTLCHNPSHLEFVGAVALGETRAKQDQYHQSLRGAVCPIILHGDAAIAGQGIVYETANMMNLEGYSVGGSIHIVANNQVGFTTNPFDARTANYCTDIAKVTGVPVFHVNGDDVEAVNFVSALCAEYRQTFARDVYLDIVCYRRHGHNEADEPMFTQPVLYKAIKNKPTVLETYGTYLKNSNSNTFTDAALQDVYQQYRDHLLKAFDKAKNEHLPIKFSPWTRGWKKLELGSEADIFVPQKTGVDEKVLRDLARRIATLPTDFVPNPKLSRIVVQDRMEMAEGKKKLDWGMGELLAYATLANQGFCVRLAGQDARRGTFAHRHVTLVDDESGKFYCTLNSSAERGGRFEVVDSLLSETAAMGFEYGYASSHDQALVLWEGQFGDFANGAQVIIDQFLMTGEAKWGRMQGLVLLLPHGYEGQGPEHSSGRVERFLQQAAEGNAQVCFFTTASQLFHALRRQVLRSFRKPLILMSPKSYLRNPRTTVDFADLVNGSFSEVLADPRKIDAESVKKVILCTGKISLEMLDFIEKEENAAMSSQTAIVRIEQVAPFPHSQLLLQLKKYKNLNSLVWLQEEPQNMGCYSYVYPKLYNILKQLNIGKNLRYVGRRERASPSVGIEKQHLIEQSAILKSALDDSQDDFQV